ncbi:unnamed protein product [Victoria cruziana]
MNVVADAFSRKAELGATRAQASEAHVEGALLARIREGMRQDATVHQLKALVDTGKTRRFWLRDDVFITKGGRVFMSRWGNLCWELLKECHDTLWAGHPGQEWTLALLERGYYWPQMQNDAEAYVKTCLICQQDKGTNQ